MAKYYGTVGFVKAVKTKKSVYTEEVTKKKYRGDVLQYSRRFQNTENLNDDFTVNNRLSIVADPYAFENFQYIRFVSWLGTNWKVTNVDVQYPRLILSIGGVYNEPEE